MTARLAKLVSSHLCARTLGRLEQAEQQRRPEAVDRLPGQRDLLRDEWVIAAR